jgi:ATP-dependent protease ClpP protease subunit
MAAGASGLMAKDSPVPAPSPRVPAPVTPPELALPNVRLHGTVDDAMLDRWLDQTAALAPGAKLVLELSTTGGDADIGRRIADDVRLLRETGRPTRFFGKTMIYSAGATIMGGFLRDDRWLSRDAMLMVHGRKLAKCVNFEGALRTERPGVEALLSEIDAGLRIERVEFIKLIEGSSITLEELERETLGDWYIPADEALRRGLIAGVI